MFDQSLNGRVVALHRCIHQSGDTVRILRIEVAGHGKNEINLFGVAIIGCAHQISLPGV